MRASLPPGADPDAAPERERAPSAERAADRGVLGGRRSRGARRALGALAGTLALVALAAGASRGAARAAAAASQATPAPPPAAERAEAARTTTVIVVRHAEKDPSGDPRDPGLSEAGRARAEALAALLARSRASALFASEFRRTRETLAPLAARLGLETLAVPAADPRALLAKLDALPPGSVAVVAGHSNTVPALVRALGGEVAGLGPALDEAEFGRAFVVARCGARAEVLELAYGG